MLEIMCLNTKIFMIISMFYLHDCNWISLVKPCPNVWKCQISFSNFLDPNNWIFLIHYPLSNLTSTFDILNHLANALIMWKIFFEKHIWWFPLIKGRYFYIQGFDSLTYLNPCKNEVCFNILSIWTSHMAFLLHVKR